jgi:hypothetical protein
MWKADQVTGSYFLGVYATPQRLGGAQDRATSELVEAGASRIRDAPAQRSARPWGREDHQKECIHYPVWVLRCIKWVW